MVSVLIILLSIYLYAHLVRATSQLIDSQGLIKVARRRRRRSSPARVDMDQLVGRVGWAEMHLSEEASLADKGAEVGAK